MTAALITAIAVLAASILTQVVTSARSRADRRYERRVKALNEVQDAVLTLQELTWRYGLAVREATASAELVDGVFHPAASAEMSIQWRTARARLRVMVSRVDDVHVAEATSTWQELVESNAVSSLDVSSAEEQEAFDAVVEALGQAARSQSGRAANPSSWLRGRHRAG